MPNTSLPDRPNIILICTDQWRGDALSHLGHPVVHTPWLDQMALEGASFTRAYAAVPSCIAARASLFTGLTPRSHGRVGYADGVPWDYPVTLAGEFTRQDYQTQSIGKMHVYPERSQLGFQNVVLHDGYLHFARRRDRDIGLVDDYLPWLRERYGADADYFDHGLNCNANVARPWDKPEHLHPTNWVVTKSAEFLRQRDTRKPFFLFMSFHRPHPPYDPPAWAFEQYLDAPMPDVPVGDWVDVFADCENGLNPDCSRGKVRPDILRRARAGYYAHMTHIDHQINRFMEILREFRLHDSTYVCFTSDHGEMLGDHHLWRKTVPYEGSTRVPLVLAGPRDSGIKPGVRPAHAVELRDIMPTLLECAGLPIPDSIEGQSLLTFAQGEEQPWREYVHGEHTHAPGNPTIQWLTDGREKYIWMSKNGHQQLFDLTRDPHELHDLAKDKHHAPRVELWRKRLVVELAGREEGHSDGTNLIPGRPVKAVLRNGAME